MRRWSKQFRSAGVGLAEVAAVLWLAGCASPGVPRPPSLHLPAPVRDLSALRSGDAVELHFTAPEETTDHLPLVRKGVPVPLTAIVCRVQGAGCLSVARLAVTPGQPVQTRDALPPALTLGPGRPVGYRVRVENGAGRDAGLSREAPAAAGAVPPAIRGLVATTVAQGVQLTWQAALNDHAAIHIEAVAAAGSAVTVSGKATSPAAGGLRLLQVPAGRRDPGGAIDTAPQVGTHVTYRAYRERTVTVDGQTLLLRGVAADVQTVRAADVFAPAAPLGLLAVSFAAEGGGPAVSLSWEASPEQDVTGYYVYRSEGGAFHRITPNPVPGVSFSDTAQTGLPTSGRMRYAVSAVDRAGNESARSAATEVEVR